MAGTRERSGRGPVGGGLARLAWGALLVAAVAACGEDPGAVAAGEPLARLGTYALGRAVDDPSGIAAADGVLFVVSDRKRKVFAVTRYGVPVDDRTLEVATDGDEGFEAAAWTGDELLVAREPTGEILRVDGRDGSVRAVVPVAGVADGNSGIEGLLVRADGRVLVAKEKDPTLLIELAADGTERSRVPLDFAPDIAGLADVGDAACPDQLLAVSQEARTVYQIDAAGGLRGAWPIDADRPEGLAFVGGDLYVADEAARALLVYAFRGGCREVGSTDPPAASGVAPAGAVRINEVVPANTASGADPFGEHDDWIELHNASDRPAHLTGFHLSDDPDDPRKVRLSADLRIPPGGHLVLWADRSPEQGPDHLGFALGASHETVILSDPDGVELDRHTWADAPDDRAYARFPDGSGRFTACDRATPGAPNGAACAAAP